MMPLLPDVYKGRLTNDSATLDEYGGQKVDAQVVPGGIKIAAVSQNELEYDPALYQRDRGELDWDAQSIASTAMLSDGASLHPAKSQFYAAGRTPPAKQQPTGYDQYMAHGPDIELSRFDTQTDKLPLLGHAQQGSGSGYFDQNYSSPNGTPGNGSTATLPRYQYQGHNTPPPPVPQYPPGMPQYPPSMQRGQPSEGYREAPVHRPSPAGRNPSTFSDGSEGGRNGGGNMAGRGAYRGGR